jgi:hypothetical protein
MEQSLCEDSAVSNRTCVSKIAIMSAESVCPSTVYLKRNLGETGNFHCFCNRERPVENRHNQLDSVRTSEIV